MNILLLEAHEVAADGSAYLEGTRARHVIDVLRARPGDDLRAGQIDGPSGRARVLDAQQGRVRLQCSFDAEALPPPLDLLLALPRPKVLRRLWPQLAAMGLRHIFLTNAWRVEKNYFSTHLLAPERLRAGLLEGLQQAGLTLLPTFSLHRHLRKLIEDDLDTAGAAYRARLLAHPRAPLRLGRWRPAAVAAPRVLLAVGPEGGWVPDEVALFERHGFQAVGLGTEILRSDTACIALLAVLKECLAREGPG